MNICVDFDGTICFTEFNNGAYDIIEFNKALILTVNKLYDEGHKIIIYTARHWDKMSMTMEQVQLSGIKFNLLTMGKPVADFYIDDRALKPEEFVELFKNN